MHLATAWVICIMTKSSDSWCIAVSRHSSLQGELLSQVTVQAGKQGLQQLLSRRCVCLQGIPCVQAVGEGEAMCAALNICGWAHACHTLDVDALLFGAITVYRQMHLLVSCPEQLGSSTASWTGAAVQPPGPAGIV